MAGFRRLQAPGDRPASLIGSLPCDADAAFLADMLAECATPGATLILGVTGGVAAGKTTLCSAIANCLQTRLRVDVVSTDGFLFPNDVLTARGILMRKGYPESYDTALLGGVLQRARWGAVRVPGYSHATYDRAPELDRTIDRPDILLVEGLGFSLANTSRNPATLLDLLIYIEAQEADLETWYVERFLRFWRDAKTDPGSFYARFSHLDEAGVELIARQVWGAINLPNLRDNIAPLREHADLRVVKRADHRLRLESAVITQTE
jgi:type I pantothenate kinase